MLKTYNDYLNESKKVGVLYHYTSLVNLLSILENNILKGKNTQSKEDNRIEDKFKYKPYISLTRNPNFHKHSPGFGVNKSVRISLDGDKLSNKYIIKPYEYSMESIGDEFEERIWLLKGDGVYNIKSYILKIDVYLKPSEDINNMLNDVKRLLPNIEISLNSKPYVEISAVDLEKLNKIYNRGNYKFERYLNKLDSDNLDVFDAFRRVDSGDIKMDLKSISENSFEIVYRLLGNYFSAEVNNIGDFNYVININTQFKKDIDSKNHKTLLSVIYDIFAKLSNFRIFNKFDVIYDGKKSDLATIKNDIRKKINTLYGF